MGNVSVSEAENSAVLQCDKQDSISASQTGSHIKDSKSTASLSHTSQASNGEKNPLVHLFISVPVHLVILWSVKINGTVKTKLYSSAWQ